MWWIRKRNSIQKLKGVTYGTRGVFSYLRDLLKILQFGLLCNVATLALNIATLVVPPPETLRRWISMSRRRFCPSLERRDVEPERRDVASIYCLEASHFLPYSNTHLHTPLPEPTVTTFDHLAAAETTSLPLLTPVLPYSVPVSHIHYHAVVP